MLKTSIKFHLLPKTDISIKGYKYVNVFCILLIITLVFLGNFFLFYSGFFWQPMADILYC